MGKLKFLPQSTFEKSILCRGLVMLDIINKNPNISLNGIRGKMGVKSKRISRKELEDIARRFLLDKDK
jgi:hypothetical protein